MWPELPQDKAAARRTVRAGRRARGSAQGAQERRAASAALADQLAIHLHGRPIGLAALYTALPTEPPTDLAITMLRDSGWRVMLPILLPDNDLAWDDGNTRDPSYVAEATLVIVPALAVDVDGGRLGQGGGSYDRVLRRIQGDPTPVIAMVYDDEVVRRVPRESHDQGVGAVLTPRGGVRGIPLRDDGR